MRLILFLALAATLSAQQNTNAPTADDKERQELNQALAEAGNSPVDFIRALERHLEKYPQSKQKSQIERAITKSAIDSKDNKKIIQHGLQVIAEGADSDLDIIDRVIRALLATDDAAQAKQALPLAQRYTRIYEKILKEPPGNYSVAQWQEQIQRAIARSLVLQARAVGNTGNIDEAATLARKAWETYPVSEAAREAGRWISRQNKPMEAVQFYALAFALEDPQSTEIDRGRDRVHMGELYSKVNGSEKGLGDLILQAYDKAAALTSDRLARLKLQDPNASATSLFDFTLPSLDGKKKVALSSLKGKTIVLDFWATWCGPCRAEHPLLEKIKEKYASQPGVVFLSVNADEEQKAVGPFLKETGWKQEIYVDPGMVSLLKINAIPTLLIVSPQGEISSRLTGFVPERFEDLLTQRIDEAMRSK